MLYPCFQLINSTKLIHEKMTPIPIMGYSNLISGICKIPGYRCLSTLEFVPKCEPVKCKDVEILKQFLDNTGSLCVLTGAGISTESGIPDYRSADVGLYARKGHRPVLYKEFCDSEAVRKRYWARNYVGWPRFSSFQPNVTHITLKNLEDTGKVRCIITQNVDSLHKKAGSINVIELHGTAFQVMCLSCDKKISRAAFQETLKELNPDMNVTSNMMRPDGDVDLSQEKIEGFKFPSCSNCGGILKPDIVFFGDNVSRDVVEHVKSEVVAADSLLVLGSSLTVFSGYRIVLQAVDAKKPVAIVNIGETRADELAFIKLESRCGDILSKLYNSIG
ncbi:NAD-dependent protein deacylase Sirt4 [Cephus cinctus]|uniref:NAD-dependent protein deacylase n=1 Tax=Cephus cinctus TaxID=211228 RepID=A0AAJ7FI23_CEPCN|nr:NAD-dependent protein deacylase Sirt4 [Cephus cinctus]